MCKIFFLTVAAVLLCVSCSTTPRSKQPDRILFVGNSLTYVGNLPAVFSALARANGRAVRSYMIVSPGGTLSERVADKAVAPALRQCGCATLILQERGGDLFDGFGEDASVKSKQAIVSLAEIGHAKGANVVLLGTNNSPRISHDVVVEEAAAAHAAGIPYIVVSERLWRLHSAHRSVEWLLKDGGHPGKVLTLLDAILVYQQVYGAYPDAKTFVVDAPIYGLHSGLRPVLRRANAPSPNPSTPRTVAYLAAVMEKLLLALKSHAAENSP